MIVKINDTTLELPDDSTLADALSAKAIGTAGIAIAVNSTVVPKDDYATRTLADGDTILIIRAFYGG